MGRHNEKRLSASRPQATTGSFRTALTMTAKENGCKWSGIKRGTRKGEKKKTEKKQCKIVAATQGGTTTMLG